MLVMEAKAKQLHYIPIPLQIKAHHKKDVFFIVHEFDLPF
jgi:hypothetical protein